MAQMNDDIPHRGAALGTVVSAAPELRTQVTLRVTITIPRLGRWLAETSALGH